MKYAEDHFSTIASQYVRGRFGYPRELYQFLFDQCPSHDFAWDCATGTGKSAQDLAQTFNQVIATNISTELLQLATPHPRITYRFASAEDSGLDTESVDLITVAQAIHWFDLPQFWTEATRVIKPGGVMAFWGYNWPIVNAGIDQVLEEFKSIIAESWPERIAILNDGYVSIRPPLLEIPSPVFEATAQWGLQDYLSHLNSWSATRYYREQTGENASDKFMGAFTEAWIGKHASVQWPLVFKAFRKSI